MGLPLKKATTPQIVGGIVSKYNKLDAKAVKNYRALPAEARTSPEYRYFNLERLNDASAKRNYKLNSTLARLSTHTELSYAKDRALHRNIMTRWSHPFRGRNSHGVGMYGHEGFPQITSKKLREGIPPIDPTKRRLP